VEIQIVRVIQDKVIIGVGQASNRNDDFTFVTLESSEKAIPTGVYESRLITRPNGKLAICWIMYQNVQQYSFMSEITIQTRRVVYW